MALSVKINPTLSDAAETLAKTFRARSLAIIVGNCRVDYEGRASSTLEWGERIAMIKQDGSVLIHRPTGYEPVNWQPPKCMVSVRFDNGTLVVNASRPQPKETVSIEFKEIALIASGNLADSGEFALHVTEEQMKQAILIAPDLVEVGLKPLQQEKSLGEAGFTDIFAEDKEGNLVVVEIKRVAASKDAVMQLQRYLDTLRKRINRPIRGMVVAPELRKNAQPSLNALKLEFVRLAPEKCFTVLKSQKDAKLSQFLS
ncbi:MAG TPA: endonuclease NucS [Candidatus Acidoferrales bacterium]|nr:endonuclease NucS [Candidatus Acidoferrales bacterium]